MSAPAFKRAEARHVVAGDVVLVKGRYRAVRPHPYSTRELALVALDGSAWESFEPGAIVRVRTSTPAPARR